MPQYASFDHTIDPSPVIGWYDTDVLYYPNLPAEEDLLQLTPEQWVDRVNGQWVISGGVLTPYVEPTPPAPTEWFVPVSLMRKRLMAAGKWNDVVAALFADPPTMLYVLTLDVGIKNTDADAIAVLTTAGADPEVILAIPA